MMNIMGTKVLKILSDIQNCLKLLLQSLDVKMMLDYI